MPSLGKKTSGATSWHFPRAIHSVFTLHSLSGPHCREKGLLGEHLGHRKFVRIWVHRHGETRASGLRYADGRSPNAVRPGGAMSPENEDEVVETAEPIDPIGHVRVVYLGPIAPHWDVQSDFGPADVIDAFRERVLARLVLLPPARPAIPAQPRACRARRRAREPQAGVGPRHSRGRRRVGTSPAGVSRAGRSGPATGPAHRLLPAWAGHARQPTGGSGLLLRPARPRRR